MAVPLPPTATASQLALLLPPAPITLSLAQVALLLRACLPLPLLNPQGAVDLVAYHQRHKCAAYRSHRDQRLRLLDDP